MNQDLTLLPPLPNLKDFSISPGGTKHPSNFTDAGLEHLSSMKGLKTLRLHRSKVVGPGLAHLKGLDQLQWLDLGSTPLNDTAMPHIAANFPRLRRLDMLGTNITPEGLMQLVDLHWLDTVGPPDDLVGPDISQAQNRDEQKRLLEERRQARIAFYGEFSRRHIASKQKARAAGMDVPPDDVGPFGYEWSQYQKQQRLGKP